MRVRTLPPLLTLLVFALAGTYALATTNSIEADIPFQFLIGDKVFPPADYFVDVSSDGGPSVLTIRTRTTGESALFDTNQLPEKEDPKAVELVFDTVGDKTYLTEVWGVENSGRRVKHIVDGKPVERAPEASRKHVTAIRIVR